MHGETLGLVVWNSFYLSFSNKLCFTLLYE